MVTPESTPVQMQTFRQKINLFIARVVKSSCITFFMLWVVQSQAQQFVTGNIFDHPIERLAEKVSCTIDFAAVSAVAEVDNSAPATLAFLKEQAFQVKQHVKRHGTSLSDWHIQAEVTDEYRVVRYESLDADGVQWIITAYQYEDGGPVKIALRLENRYREIDVTDLKLRLNRLLRQALRIPAASIETRIVVSGKVPYVNDYERYLLNLFEETNLASLKYISQEQNEIKIAAYSPFLPLQQGKVSTSDLNLQMILQSDGDVYRLTFTTPFLTSF